MQGLVLTFLFAACLGLGAFLQTWFLQWQGNRVSSQNVLSVLMGDSRRMFANHFFVKADVYFHRGYYPTIFDNGAAYESSHPAEEAAEQESHHEHEADADHHEHHEHEFLGPPRDWIERMNRHFMPSVHTELSDQGGGVEREILPWLWLSAELDPQRVDTYTVASFWLSERIHNVDEAERFLRQGLRENPRSFEILLELGRLYEVYRHDTVRARNLWELGLRRWQEQEGVKEKPDTYFLEKLAVRLANLEENDGHLAAAVKYLQMALPVSPNAFMIQQRIDALKRKLG